MQNLGEGKVTHVVIDVGGSIVLPIEHLAQFTAMFEHMVPVRYSWTNSQYEIRNDGSRVEMKLLSVVDVAKIALSTES